MYGTARKWRGGGWRAGIAAVLLLATEVATAQLDEALVSQHIVTVRVFDGDKLEAEGVGVVVNDQGDVLTSSAVVNAGSRVHVVIPDIPELVAEVRWQGRPWDVAVLRVTGLSVPGLPVSETPLDRGAALLTVTPGTGPEGATFVAGSLGEVVTRRLGGRDVRFLQHNATLDHANGYGSPIVNECGEVVGMNVPDSARMSVLSVPHRMQPREVMYALVAGEIVSRLQAQGVAFASVAEACVSAAERERIEREEAEREAAEAEEQAAEAEEQAAEAAEQAAEAAQREEEARAEAERAQREADAARRERAEADRLAEEAKQREEEERQQRERMRYYVQWGVVLAAAVLLLVLLFWVLSAHRKRRALHTAESRAEFAEQEAAQAWRRVAEIPDPAPFDCVLTGEDRDGVPFAMNIGREALGSAEGVLIGRDPARATHVAADPSVSRAHARMLVEDGELHVQDAGSTNGTYLNGQRLAAGADARVRNGDELILGSLTLRVELRR